VSILAAQTIRRLCVNPPYIPEGTELISPFQERGVHMGMSYGLSSNGYDVRIGPEIHYPNAELSRAMVDLDGPMIIPRRSFVLAATLEHFALPDWLCMKVHDKSTWARQGIFVQNTIAEAGWRGWLTLEISNDSRRDIAIWPGTPIAQAVFETLDEPTEQPYSGKYQNQGWGPQAPRHER
jgi:dCTP deaminase